MPHIFGRNAPPDHPLESKLAGCDAAANSDRLVAETWRYDWRVSPDRERTAATQLCAAVAQPALRHAYGDYFHACICHGAPCEYVSACNSSNVLPVGMSDLNYLCRVLCLNTQPFQLAAQQSPALAKYAPDWEAWLDRSIEEARRSRGVLGLRDLLTDLFDAWNNWKGLNQRPTWASSWEDVKPVLLQPDWPDQLRDAFGLGGYGANQWLVVLRYERKKAGCCYRPTCLDADWQPWHMISPPHRPTGYALDLSEAGGRCCPEVIHAPFPLDIDHWTGDIGRTASLSGKLGTEALRRRHYRELRTRFPKSGTGWLPPSAL